MTDPGHWFQTASGGRLFLDNPNPDDILVDDIAASLSRICRFCGHLKAGVETYSVAEHSVLVSRIVESIDPDLAFDGLCHDLQEFALSDVIRPLKRMLPEYKELEEKWASVLAEKFGLFFPTPRAVKLADSVALITERRDLQEPPRWDWVEYELGIEPWPEPIVPMLPSEAKRLFLKRWEELRP